MANKKQKDKRVVQSVLANSNFRKGYRSSRRAKAITEARHRVKRGG